MDFFSNLFGKKTTSKDQAKSRLQFVLIQDRMNCSTQVLEMLKNDILKVIANYMEIDDDELDIHIVQPGEEKDTNTPVLYANIPIKNIKQTK